MILVALSNAINMKCCWEKKANFFCFDGRNEKNHWPFRQTEVEMANIRFICNRNNLNLDLTCTIPSTGYLLLSGNGNFFFFDAANVKKFYRMKLSISSARKFCFIYCFILLTTTHKYTRFRCICWIKNENGRWQKVT